MSKYLIYLVNNRYSCVMMTIITKNLVSKATVMSSNASTS